MVSPAGSPADDVERREEPIDVVARRSLTGGPFLVKVDRYGSVSGLVRVRVPLGMLHIVTGSNEAGSFDPFPSV